MRGILPVVKIHILLAQENRSSYEIVPARPRILVRDVAGGELDVGFAVLGWGLVVCVYEDRDMYMCLWRCVGVYAWVCVYMCVCICICVCVNV